MRFALLGDHPDGVSMACALAATGRHEIATCTTVAVPALERLRAQGWNGKVVNDLEEVLADPQIEAVIVASRLTLRPQHLRRALQSERHVLCVHPPDDTPDIAYEAALIQGDTRQRLLPLLAEFHHPALARLGQLLRNRPIRLLNLERRASTILVNGQTVCKACLPDWMVLRVLGGEIAEVSGFAAQEEIAVEGPLLLSGRFEQGGLFQATLLSSEGEPTTRLTVYAASGPRQPWAHLAYGVDTAQLTWHDEADVVHEESWNKWDPWSAMVEAFDASPVRVAASEGRKALGDQASRPSWQDAIRCLELDDALRRSVERRRASLLEYPEASEEVGFKGTMTLVGCGVLWAILGMLVVSAWYPAVGWAVLPILALFLSLQLFRWLIPRNKTDA